VTIAAVVLAAGGGSRFHGTTHKLLSLLRGKPVAAWAIEAARDAALDETVVVLGSVDVAQAVNLDGVTTLRNKRWSDGIATSLALAIDHAVERGHDAIVVGLGDQPFVTAAAWRAVAAASSSPIAVATYDGARRNPVRLAREVWPLLDRDGDDGARALMRRRPDLVGEVACRGIPADVDTLEDLTQWS
jgi:CTP:molybdopterin cytidylyltransferase MocA